MNNEVLQFGNLMGAILQPLYFCLFMFAVKRIEKNRILFIIVSVVDYFIIQNVVKFNLGVNADIFYAVIFYINLNIFYHNHTKITDVVTYVLSNILMGIINIISFMTFGMNFIGLISALIIPNLLVILFYNHMNKLEKFYNKFWNRHSDKKMLKSVTIRGISAVSTILLFVTLHFWVIYLLLR